MEKNNNKVPVAILSCFLIAFILQGILKISGVFIFEKALNWEIFKIIDNHKWLQIIYYSLISMISVYSLSFALTSRPYSDKWYHYFIIILSCFMITTLKLTVQYNVTIQIIYDIILYILVPIIINFSTQTKYLAFKTKNLNCIVFTITIQVLLYFCYLGVCYWSSMLNSIIIINQVFLVSSAMFLIFFETYIGMILLMLTLNYFIKLKGEK